MFISQSQESVILASKSANMTREIGIAFSASLYKKATTIFLQGELGSGKTTFTKGLGLGLGLGNIVTSPTYALENRYGSTSSPQAGETLLHLDLFRLEPSEARKMLAASEEFPGVRVVEWSERLRVMPRSAADPSIHPSTASPSRGTRDDMAARIEALPAILITFEEISPTERRIEITFNDIALPDRETIERWRSNVKLPEHIARHCDIVGAFARKCAEELLRRGKVTRPQAVQHAGELHDLFRFVDFHVKSRRDFTGHVAQPPIWQTLSQRYPGSHEEACAQFLEKQGYSALGVIVRPHGLRTIDVPRGDGVALRGHPNGLNTIEQKLLFYADKRVLFDRVVSLDERFEDFMQRYGKGTESEQAKRWRQKTEELEHALFGDDLP